VKLSVYEPYSPYLAADRQIAAAIKKTMIRTGRAGQEESLPEGPACAAEAHRVLCIVFVALMAHIAEIAVYGVAYAVAVDVLAIGSFGGMAVEHPLHFLYFSIVSYTSLGLGDVFPSGHLRFLTGIEALNGLLLIAWSGSFIYFAMGRLWPWERCVEPARPARP